MLPTWATVPDNTKYRISHAHASDCAWKNKFYTRLRWRHPKKTFCASVQYWNAKLKNISVHKCFLKSKIRLDAVFMRAFLQWIRVYNLIPHPERLARLCFTVHNTVVICQGVWHKQYVNQIGCWDNFLGPSLLGCDILVDVKLLVKNFLEAEMNISVRCPQLYCAFAQ